MFLGVHIYIYICKKNAKATPHTHTKTCGCGSLPPVAAEIISLHSSSEMSSPISAKICARPLGWIAVTVSFLGVMCKRCPMIIYIGGKMHAALHLTATGATLSVSGILGCRLEPLQMTGANPIRSFGSGVSPVFTGLVSRCLFNWSIGRTGARDSCRFRRKGR